MLKLSNSCDVVPQVAHRALFAATAKREEIELNHSVTNVKNKTWATEVEVAGTTYVVAQVRDKPHYFLCFPIPFRGNQGKVKPFRTVRGLLRQLKRL